MAAKEPEQGIISKTVESIAMFFSARGRQLSAEKNKAILSGPEADIYRIRKLDRKIGKLMKPFNTATRVPSEIVEAIEADIKKIQGSFARVAAVKPQENIFELNATDLVVRVMRGDEEPQPVRHLEYINTYRSPSGGNIEQRVARITLGG